MGDWIPSNDKVRDYLPYSTPLEGRTLGRIASAPEPTQNRYRIPLASTEHIIIPVVRDLFYDASNSYIYRNMQNNLEGR